MDNRDHFHRKKIANGLSVGRKSALAALSMTKKTHLTGILQALLQCVAHFGRKRRGFRRKFEQRDRQLAVAYANGVQNVIPAILF